MSSCTTATATTLTASAPVSRRYDLLVVAGQAAIDRYATQGIAWIPRSSACSADRRPKGSA